MGIIEVGILTKNDWKFKFYIAVNGKIDHYLENGSPAMPKWIGIWDS